MHSFKARRDQQIILFDLLININPRISTSSSWYDCACPFHLRHVHMQPTEDVCSLVAAVVAHFPDLESFMVPFCTLDGSFGLHPFKNEDTGTVCRIPDSVSACLLHVY